jgi:hypothetical protein
LNKEPYPDCHNPMKQPKSGGGEGKSVEVDAGVEEEKVNSPPRKRRRTLHPPPSTETTIEDLLGELLKLGNDFRELIKNVPS